MSTRLTLTEQDKQLFSRVFRFVLAQRPEKVLVKTQPPHYVTYREDRRSDFNSPLPLFIVLNPFFTPQSRNAFYLLREAHKSFKRRLPGARYWAPAG